MLRKLEDYNFPDDLKKMDAGDLDLLSFQIRDFLIDSVSKTGGHLAPNLGVVELSIAIHKVFNSPEDRIIWDVGHQAYIHKILTGRAKDFGTLRKLDGLSGFPKRKESPHDIYDTGHSSTSISAASGIAAARDIKGDDYNVLAVIGDGSLTGGMAYEAINNLGMSVSKVIVILNDNGMSISPNIGGVSEHLGKLRTSKGYINAKKKVKGVVERIPGIGPALKTKIGDAKDVIKYAFVQGGVIFEELGLTYIGPIDGHNIKDLMDALEICKNAEGSVLLHVITKKGKGYRLAEENPDKFHGIGAFDKDTGKTAVSSTPSFSSIFGKSVTELADKHDDVVALTAAMCDGTGLTGFAQKYPKRFFDVGIAEAHGVTFAAGLALNGMKPYISIYSTFLQRGYDQIVEDVALQNIPVVLCIDRAGIVGADGETHQGIFDLSYLLHIPNMTVMAPADGKQLKEMIDYSYNMETPCAIRYPRGNDYEKPLVDEEFSGQNIKVREGKDCQILAVGTMLDTALKAADLLKEEGIEASVINVGLLKPLEVKELVDDNKLTVTIEDNVVIGGFGALYKVMTEDPEVLNLGWPDQFIEHGDVKSLYERYGLDPKSVAERIRTELERKA